MLVTAESDPQELGAIRALGLFWGTAMLGQLLVMQSAWSGNTCLGGRCGFRRVQHHFSVVCWRVSATYELDFKHTMRYRAPETMLGVLASTPVAFAASYSTPRHEFGPKAYQHVETAQIGRSSNPILMRALKALHLRYHLRRGVLSILYSRPGA